MASYDETVRFVGIIDRGLARFEAIKAEWKKARKPDAVIKKAANKISDWQNVKKVWLKSLNVSADSGFNVQAVSIGKKGMMVTVSHPSMKRPVTRHLLRKNGIYTGRAPFGADTFIEYDVTIAGDEKMLALKTNALSGKFKVLDNAA